MYFLRILSAVLLFLPNGLHAASLSDLAAGGVVPNGDVLFSNFTIEGGDTGSGIFVDPITGGDDTYGLRFDFGFDTFAINSQLLRSGGFDVNVFDPTRRIVRTYIEVLADVDDRAFGPFVEVRTSVLETRLTRTINELFDEAQITDGGPYSETWSIFLQDSGAPEDEFDVGGAFLSEFRVYYELGDRAPLSEVPVPASGWLLAFAMGGLALRRRRT